MSYTIFNGQVLLNGSYDSMEIEHRVLIDGNVLKIRRFKFDLTAEDHLLDTSSSDTFTWYKNGVSTPGTFASGVYVVDTTDLNEININGVDYRVTGSTWETYTPWSPPTISTAENTAAIQGLLISLDNITQRIDVLEGN